MTQTQLTIDHEMLQHLFTQDGSMKQLVEGCVQQLLQAEVAQHLQAEPYVRSSQRTGQRNGTKPRTLVSRAGVLELQLPQVRDGSFHTELFARYQRCEQALAATLMEMVIGGVSTRKVARITEELCGKTFSKSTVSALCTQLDPVVKAWNERRLEGKAYPFLLVDAIYVKVRSEGRVRSQAFHLAVGINASGTREILGCQLYDGESTTSWKEFFLWLNTRGLSGIDLVVSDAHGGLVSAVQETFVGASWQRCQAHFLRNIEDACPKALQKELHPRLVALLHAPDEAAARAELERVLTRYEQRAPKAMAILEEGFEDAIAVLALPESIRTRLRTTNAVERLNQELRRRERVVRIFPAQQSVTRLLGMVLLEQDEVWQTNPTYLDMQEYGEWREHQHTQRKEVSSVAA